MGKTYRSNFEGDYGFQEHRVPIREQHRIFNAKRKIKVKISPEVLAEVKRFRAEAQEARRLRVPPAATTPEAVVPTLQPKPIKIPLRDIIPEIIPITDAVGPSILDEKRVDIIQELSEAMLLEAMTQDDSGEDEQLVA